MATAPSANPVAAQAAHDTHQAAHGDHPTALTYVKVGFILTAITVAEVWAYYVPSLVEMKGVFVTLLLTLSAIKFFTVVLFYMHLKYDNKLFRFLFTGPLLVAAMTMMILMFLFGKLAVRLGLLT